MNARNPAPPSASGHGAFETTLAGIIIPPGGLMFKELAGNLGVHPKTVSRWARAGKLILAFTPGGRPRVLGVQV